MANENKTEKKAQRKMLDANGKPLHALLVFSARLQNTSARLKKAAAKLEKIGGLEAAKALHAILPLLASASAEVEKMPRRTKGMGRSKVVLAAFNARDVVKIHPAFLSKNAAGFDPADLESGLIVKSQDGNQVFVVSSDGTKSRLPRNELVLASEYAAALSAHEAMKQKRAQEQKEKRQAAKAAAAGTAEAPVEEDDGLGEAEDEGSDLNDDGDDD